MVEPWHSIYSLVHCIYSNCPEWASTMPKDRLQRDAAKLLREVCRDLLSAEEKNERCCADGWHFPMPLLSRNETSNLGRGSAPS